MLADLGRAWEWLCGAASANGVGAVSRHSGLAKKLTCFAPQDKPLDLAARRLRQGGYEIDLARIGMGGQSLAHHLLYFCF